MSVGIRQQLGKLKTRGEKLLDRYDKLSPKWNADTKVTAIGMLSTIETHLARLNEKFQQWEAFIEDIEEDTDRDTEQKLYDQWINADEYSNLIEDLEDIVNIVTKLSTNGERPQTPIESRVPAKIVVQSIQKFDGEYMKWKPFWQRFELNIDSKEYPPIEKLDSLIGLLEGKALEGNTDRILYELQNQLYLIPPANPNAKSLRETVTSINNLCLQIQNLDIDINTPTMKWDIIRKMPIAEQTELTITVQTQPRTTTSDILKKMKEYELKAEIRTNIQRDGCSSFPIASPLPGPSRSFTNKWVCSFCNGDHPSGTCETYKTIDERFDQLRSKRCCFKCAGRNHSSKECRVTVKCQHCNGNHRSFLCNKLKNNNYNKLDSTSKTNTFVAVERKQSPLLAKEITVKNSETNKEAKAVVFLDSGSQRNFISNDLINKLKLTPIGYENINVEGIAENQTRYQSKLVEVSMLTLDGTELCISAYSIPSIAKSIPIVEVKDTDRLDYHTTNKKPDILVGMDDFFSIITAVKQKGEIFIVDSKIGKMISGKLEKKLEIQEDQQIVTCSAITTSSAAGEDFISNETSLPIGEWMEQHEMLYGKANLCDGQFELG